MRLFFSSSQSKGFTLIELLVVISIISMLSSVVLVALQGARDKGRVGAGLKFATYNYHAFGADTFALYDFNSATLGADSGPNNFTVTCSGVTADAAKRPSGSGSSGLFAGGTNQGCGLNFSSPYPTLASTWTMSAWVYIATAADITGNAKGIIRIEPVGGGGTLASLLIYTDTTNQIQCQQGAFANTPALISSSLLFGTWHHIACTYNGTAVSLYLDGKRLSGPIPSTLFPNTRSANSIGVGELYINDPTFNFKGNIDDAAVYAQALSENDIQDIYARGLPTHMLANVQ